MGNCRSVIFHFGQFVRLLSGQNQTFPRTENHVRAVFLLGDLRPEPVIPLAPVKVSDAAYPVVHALLSEILQLAKNEVK